MQLRSPLPAIPGLGHIRADLEISPGPAASIVLHAVLLVAFAWFATGPRARTLAPVEPLTVGILSAKEFAALTQPHDPVDQPPPATGPASVALPPAIKPPALTHAATILSNALGPSVRRQLNPLRSDARFEQICGVEAMEQIAKAGAFRPERTVAYATADTKVVGDLMVADGAAFLSGGRWFGLAFRCQATADRLKVLSFDFAIGEPITSGRGLGSGAAED